MFIFTLRRIVIQIMKLQVMLSDIFSTHCTKQSPIIDINYEKYSVPLIFNCEILFSQFKNFLGPLYRRSEIIKINARTWLDKGHSVEEFSLKDIYVVWEMVFPGEKSGQFIALDFNVGKEYKVNLKVYLILVVPYSLPWYFIEKIVEILLGISFF